MFSTRPEISGSLGAVASTHWLASQSGMAILEAGGNAFDAAATAGFVLQVVEPHLNGPGGDMPVLFRTRAADVRVLCGQGVAPSAATIGHFEQLGLTSVPGTGLLPAAVPGTCVAWFTLLRDYGTMTPAQVLCSAIEYAYRGFPAASALGQTIDAVSDLFAAHWPTSAATWLPAPRTGELVSNPVLAQTYRRLAAESERGSSREAQCDAAIAAWSEGFVAEAVDAFMRVPIRDSSGGDHAGVLTGADLSSWTPSYEEPMSVHWRGYRVFKCAGWTQGPAFLQSLALLDPLLDDVFDPAHLGRHLSAQTVHLIAEVQKLALADRDAWFGDASDAPALNGLLDAGYLEGRRALLSADASLALRPGHLDGQVPRLSRRIVAPDTHHDLATGTGEPTVAKDGRTRGDTCHLDVTDRWGNVVSATPSGGWLQSSPTVPELGFCVGTRLQMCWLEPGLPSSLEPGTRPRTTLSPSLSVSPEGVATAFGTPGGDQQDQWPLPFWLTHTVGGLGLQAAMDRPAFHLTALVSSFQPRTWVPGGLQIEDRFSRAARDDLESRGHRLTVRDPWSLGRISAASYDPRDGLVRAAADPRGGQGYAVGR